MNIHMAMRPQKRWSQELARTNERTASRSTLEKNTFVTNKRERGIGTMLDLPKTAP